MKPLADDKDLKRSIDRIERAWEDLRKHVLIGPLVQRARLKIIDYEPQVAAMFVTVSASGEVYANPYNYPRTPGEWQFVLAHALMHLAFGHPRRAERGMAWNIACDCVVNEFLMRMKIGTMPEKLLRLPPGMPNNEEKLFGAFRERGGAPKGETTNGAALDMTAGASKANWADIFARAVRAAARKCLSSAGSEPSTPAQVARAWFIRNFPLLGSVLQLLKIVENAKLCERLGIRVAAVAPLKKEILVNPGWALEDPELRYVLAHMALHAGLQHVHRRGGRDPFLWNAACDYCVNSWLARTPALTRMCKAPTEGMLLSTDYTDLPPEEIYERLLTQEKTARKLVTFASQGASDVLYAPDTDEPAPLDPVERLLGEALVRGYQLHAESGKGTLPYTLIDEIRALETPPDPWDVLLGRWFDEHIPPLERIRTYGRPSRRQSATPGIARPRYIWPDMETAVKATFGLIIDASGGLKASIAQRALGTIMSYALARNLPAVRVVLCGAEANDLGLVPTDELIQRFAVSERSSAVLGPAAALLEESRDFPFDSPLLFLTGLPCDRIKTQRAHAFVVPERGRLTFQTDAPVFHVPVD
jgi:predicted metal-dependent peptidase